MSFREDEEPWPDRCRYRPNPRYHNPFKTISLRTLRAQKVLHPVERALELANFSSDRDDLDRFKIHRNTVLKCLEPQYQRVAAPGDVSPTGLDKRSKIATFQDEAAGIQPNIQSHLKESCF